MQLKQYLEPDMRTAMRKVRADLGADAVIISTATAAEGVEVLAALDYDPVLAAQLQGSLRGGAGEASPATPRARPESAPAAPIQPAASGVDPVITSMQAELSRLRGLFEEELAEISWQERGRRQPGRLALQNQLQRIGLSRVRFAAQLAPTDLYDAKKALDAANQEFVANGDTQKVHDYALADIMYAYLDPRIRV